MYDHFPSKDHLTPSQISIPHFINPTTKPPSHPSPLIQPHCYNHLPSPPPPACNYKYTMLCFWLILYGIEDMCFFFLVQDSIENITQYIYNCIIISIPKLSNSNPNLYTPLTPTPTQISTSHLPKPTTKPPISTYSTPLLWPPPITSTRGPQL